MHEFSEVSGRGLLKCQRPMKASSRDLGEPLLQWLSILETWENIQVCNSFVSPDES